MRGLLTSRVALACAASAAVLYLAAGALVMRTDLLVAVGLGAARLAASPAPVGLRALARY